MRKPDFKQVLPKSVYLCLYIYIYVSVYIYIYVYIHIYIHLYFDRVEVGIRLRMCIINGSDVRSFFGSLDGLFALRLWSLRLADPKRSV